MPGLSPFTQEVLRMAWEELFDSNSQLFLPDALRGVLDPLSYAGPSPAVSVTVPEDIADSACTSTGHDFNPVATGMPALQVKNARIRGLHAIRSESTDLAFSGTEPELTATVYSGELRKEKVPLTVESDSGPNYGFAIGCCVPVNGESRQCSGKRWTASANGKFKASIANTKMQLTLRADFPASGSPTITVKAVKVAVDQKDIQVDFDIAGLDEMWADMASLALEQGIAQNAVQIALQGYFDGTDFKKQLGQILTQKLNEATELL